MTVAAVILSATTEGALADTLGQPRVRRLADLAWSGGALPIVVVAADPDGAVAAALVGSEAVYGSPAPPEAGPAGQMVRGTELAMAEVRDTTAVLLWPARMTWVGPETITSLIEAHGTARDAMLRPTWHGDPGWPVLLPTSHLAALARRGARPDAARRHRGPRGRRSQPARSRSATRASMFDVETDRGGPAGLRGPARSARRPHPRMGRRRRGRGRPGRTVGRLTHGPGTRSGGAIGGPPAS